MEISKITWIDLRLFPGTFHCWGFAAGIFGSHLQLPSIWLNQIVDLNFSCPLYSPLTNFCFFILRRFNVLSMMAVSLHIKSEFLSFCQPWRITDLGKGSAIKSNDFFGKVPEGVGCHFQSKKLYCRFWELKTVFFSKKLIKKSNFRVQGMFFSSSTFVLVVVFY